MSTTRDPRTGRYVEHGSWPDARLRSDAPAHVTRVQETCRALRDRINESGKSIRQVAEEAGVAHTTITRVLRGETWCDVATLAALEDALGEDIWTTRKTGLRTGRIDE